MRPIVGISCYLEAASWGAWHDVPAALLPHAYVQHVQRAGGVPVLIPPGADAAALVPRLDALILAGGPDIDPGRYDAAAHPAAQQSRPDRDEAEIALLHTAIYADLPVLGICRGMQLMAVAAAGTLQQHLPDVIGHHRHSPAPGRYGTHRVQITPGSRLHTILGDTVDVPSYHHQSVDTHPEYAPTAHALDGTLEALEAPEALFRIGVQWHPETSTDPRLFAALVHVAHDRGAPDRPRDRAK
jgi:putative glutamine amidotransferase